MKDKIIASLKAKFPKLSDTRIANYAVKLEAKVKEEDDIDAKIDDMNDDVDFAEVIKLDAKVAKLEAEKKKAKEKKVEEPAEGEEDEDQPEDKKKEHRKPNEMKALLDAVKALSEKVQSFETEKTTSTFKQKVADRLKDIPAMIWNERPIPKTDEELEAFVTKVNDDYTAFSQEEANASFGSFTKPKNSTGGGSKNAPSTAEIDRILDKIIK